MQTGILEHSIWKPNHAVSPTLASDFAGINLLAGTDRLPLVGTNDGLSGRDRYRPLGRCHPGGLKLHSS